MKRWFILVLALLAVFIVGCGQKQSAGDLDIKILSMKYIDSQDPYAQDSPEHTMVTEAIIQFENNGEKREEIPCNAVNLILNVKAYEPSFYPERQSDLTRFLSDSEITGPESCESPIMEVLPKSKPQYKVYWRMNSIIPDNWEESGFDKPSYNGSLTILQSEIKNAEVIVKIGKLQFDMGKPDINFKPKEYKKMMQQVAAESKTLETPGQQGIYAPTEVNKEECGVIVTEIDEGAEIINDGIEISDKIKKINDQQIINIDSLAPILKDVGDEESVKVETDRITFNTKRKNLRALVVSDMAACAP